MSPPGATRRTQCKNNLKQIGLALHNYHDVYLMFPQAEYSGDTADPTAENFLSQWAWGTMILPFLEQGNLYEALNPGPQTYQAAFNDPVRLQLIQTPLAVWICPSDPESSVNRNRPILPRGQKINASCDGIDVAAEVQVAKSNYPGNSAGHVVNNGIITVSWLQNHQSVSIRDITDGTTNTFMVGERSSPNNQFAALWQGYEFGCGNNTQSWAVVGRTHSKMQTGEHPGTTADSPDVAFGSVHPGGAQFAMGDGSVRFVSENIDYNINRTDYTDDGIYQLLGGRNDGQVIGEF